MKARFLLLQRTGESIMMGASKNDGSEKPYPFGG